MKQFPKASAGFALGGGAAPAAAAADDDDDVDLFGSRYLAAFLLSGVLLCIHFLYNVQCTMYMCIVHPSGL